MESPALGTFRCRESGWGEGSPHPRHHLASLGTMTFPGVFSATCLDPVDWSHAENRELEDTGQSSWGWRSPHRLRAVTSCFSLLWKAPGCLAAFQVPGLHLGDEGVFVPGGHWTWYLFIFFVISWRDVFVNKDPGQHLNFKFIKKEWGVWGVLVAQSCLTLCNSMNYSPPGPSVGFPRQEYWSGFPFPSPGHLSTLGIKLGSPALQADFFTVWAPREAQGGKGMFCKHLKLWKQGWGWDGRQQDWKDAGGKRPFHPKVLGFNDQITFICFH